jgi:hypothetical protein
MLTHGFWQDQYSGRSDVIGETIALDGQEHTIIGVTHPKREFASFATAQIITPLVLNRGEPNRTGRYLFVSGRLAAGVTRAMATEEVRQGTDPLASRTQPSPACLSHSLLRTFSSSWWLRFGLVSAPDPIGWGTLGATTCLCPSQGPSTTVGSASQTTAHR